MERPDGTAAIASAAAAAAAVAAAEAAVADGSAGPCDGGRTSDDLDNGPAMDFVRLVSTAASRKGMHHRVVDATRALTFSFLRPCLTATPAAYHWRRFRLIFRFAWWVGARGAGGGGCGGGGGGGGSAPVAPGVLVVSISSSPFIT